MAEIVGLVASIIQVAGAGLKLSESLYQYAESVSTADRRIKDIAKEVQLTSFVIDELGGIFKQDRNKAILSNNAIKTADNTIQECSVVFLKMDAEVKKTSKNSLGKFMLPFREPKINLLRSHLDMLKSTLQLLMQVLIHAHQKISQDDREAEAAQREEIKALLKRKKTSIKRYNESLKNYTSDTEEENEQVRTLASPNHSGVSVSQIKTTVTTDTLEKCVSHVRTLLGDIEKLQQVLVKAQEGHDTSDHQQSLIGSYFRARGHLDSVLLGNPNAAAGSVPISKISKTKSEDDFALHVSLTGSTIRASDSQIMQKGIQQADSMDDVTPGTQEHSTQSVMSDFAITKADFQKAIEEALERGRNEERARNEKEAKIREIKMRELAERGEAEKKSFVVDRKEEEAARAAAEAEHYARRREAEQQAMKEAEVQTKQEKGTVEDAKRKYMEAMLRIDEQQKRAAQEAAAEAIAKETALKKSEEDTDRLKDAQPIRFTDAVGRKFSFPFHLANTWQSLNDLIKTAFSNVDSLSTHVAEGSFDIIGPDEEVIMPAYYDAVIQPGWVLRMQMWPIAKLPRSPLRPGASLPPFDSIEPPSIPDAKVPPVVVAGKSPPISEGREGYQTKSPGRTTWFQDEDSGAQSGGDVDESTERLRLIIEQAIYKQFHHFGCSIDADAQEVIATAHESLKLPGRLDKCRLQVACTTGEGVFYKYLSTRSRTRIADKLLDHAYPAFTSLQLVMVSDDVKLPRTVLLKCSDSDVPKSGFKERIPSNTKSKKRGSNAASSQVSSSSSRPSLPERRKPKSSDGVMTIVEGSRSSRRYSRQSYEDGRLLDDSYVSRPDRRRSYSSRTGSLASWSSSATPQSAEPSMQAHNTRIGNDKKKKHRIITSLHDNDSQGRLSRPIGRRPSTSSHTVTSHSNHIPGDHRQAQPEYVPYSTYAGIDSHTLPGAPKVYEQHHQKPSSSAKSNSSEVHSWSCKVVGCNSSTKDFAQQVDLTRHLATVHGIGKKYPCRSEGCAEIFYRRDDLRDHREDFHGVKSSHEQRKMLALEELSQVRFELGDSGARADSAQPEDGPPPNASRYSTTRMNNESNLESFQVKQRRDASPARLLPRPMQKVRPNFGDVEEYRSPEDQLTPAPLRGESSKSAPGHVDSIEQKRPGSLHIAKPSRQYKTVIVTPKASPRIKEAESVIQQEIEEEAHVVDEDDWGSFVAVKGSGKHKKKDKKASVEEDAVVPAVETDVSMEANIRRKKKERYAWQKRATYDDDEDAASVVETEVSLQESIKQEGKGKGKEKVQPEQDDSARSNLRPSLVPQVENYSLEEGYKAYADEDSPSEEDGHIHDDEMDDDVLYHEMMANYDPDDKTDQDSSDDEDENGDSEVDELLKEYTTVLN